MNKRSIILFSLIPLVCSCVFIRTDDSIDLGNHYRYVQDYPRTIIFHQSEKYEGIGDEIVPPMVKSYNFNNRYIIAKSEDMDDKSTKYWIVDKALKGNKVEPLDSMGFDRKIIELKINLKF